MLSKTHNSLRSYLDSLPRGGVSDFAAACDITPVYLSQLAAKLDGRAPSAELCVVIERATGAQVTRRDLRPSDWGDIWPELIDAEHPWPPVASAAKEAA